MFTKQKHKNYNKHLLLLVNYLIRIYHNIDNYYYQALLTMQQNLIHNRVYKNMNHREYYDNEKFIIDMVAYGLGKDPDQISHKIKAEFLRSQIIG